MSDYSILQSLLSHQPEGRTLAALKFFEPKTKFCTWMKRFGNTLIYDIGAGCGQVARALADSGLNVEALDLNHRAHEEFPVQIGNAITYQFKPGSIAMFCRPCHGPFVEMTIERLRDMNLFAIVYVGLSKNLDADLGIYRPRFKRVLKDSGAEHEDVYVWTLISSEQQILRIIQNREAACKADSTWWFNPFRRHGMTPDEIACALDWYTGRQLRSGLMQADNRRALQALKKMTNDGLLVEKHQRTLQCGSRRRPCFVTPEFQEWLNDCFIRTGAAVHSMSGGN